jgi:GNAT superfamily N-acetyltransferase
VVKIETIIKRCNFSRIMTIEKLSIDNIDEIIALNSQVYSKELNEQRCQYEEYEDHIKREFWELRLTSPTQEYYGFFIDNSLVGMIGILPALRCVEEYLFTSEAAIHPDFQGKGFYKPLREYIEKKARDLEYKGVVCITLSNAKSLPILLKNGHEEVGRFFYSGKTTRYIPTETIILKKTF